MPKTLTDFDVTKRWPALHPDRLQLYSLPTPNGAKVTIALEESALPYEAHFVDFSTEDQNTNEFLSLNPNNKIPAIIDPNGPGGGPLALFESGAILIYLAEKTGKLLPSDPARRYETLQWLMFQMGGVGPMFGQLGFFTKFAGASYEDKRPLQRYIDESRRLLRVLNNRLEDTQWMMGDEFTIADIAIAPWVHCLIEFYDADKVVGLSDFTHVLAHRERFLARPAVQRGLEIPTSPKP